MNFWVCSLSTPLHKAQDRVIAGWILQNTKIIFENRLWPNSNIPNIRLGEKIKKFSKSTWEYISDLRCSMPHLGKHKFLQPMEDNNDRLKKGIAQPSKILGVVHKWNDPRISLRYNEIIYIEENGELVHWQIMTNRSIHKLTIHQGVLLDVPFVVFAVEVSGTIDVGDSTAGCRGTPYEYIRSCEIVQKSIRVVLRSPSYCHIQNNSKFIVGLLKSIFAHVISKKLLEDLDVQGTSFTTSPSKLLQQLHSFLIDERLEIESTLIKKLVSCMSGNKACNNTPSTASSNHSWQAISLNQCLNDSNMIHAHNGTPTQQESTPSNCVPHFPKKLEFLPLRNIRSHDSLQSLCQLFLILFYQPFGTIVSMPIEEGAVIIANITIAMRPNDLNQLERILFFPCLNHAFHKFLQVLIIIVG